MASEDLEAVLHLEAVRESVLLDTQQSSCLHQRHRGNEAAVAALREGKAANAMVCVGKSAFVVMTTSAAERLLEKQNNVIWGEIEDVQRRVTKGMREMDDMTAALPPTNPTRSRQHL